MENGRPGLRVKKKLPTANGKTYRMVGRTQDGRPAGQTAQTGGSTGGRWQAAGRWQTRQRTGRRTCRRSTAEVEAHELQLCCRNWSSLDPNSTISGGALVGARASIASMGTSYSRPSSNLTVTVPSLYAACIYASCPRRASFSSVRPFCLSLGPKRENASRKLVSSPSRRMRLSGTARPLVSA